MSESAGFVHLQTHSDFSLLRGAARIDAMVERARELEMDHLALTDLGNLFGALKFHDACRKADINPIVGSEFYLAPDSRRSRSSEVGARYARIVLLAMTERGYRNLSMLSSLSYTEGFYYRPRIDDELIERYHEDLICLTGSVSGDIPRLLVNNRPDEARRRAEFYRSVFGDRLYFSVQNHGIPEERVVLEGLRELGRAMDVPLVATNDAYYIHREDAGAQDILTCIGGGKRRNDVDRFRFSSDEFYLKSEEEMRRLFPDMPELIDESLRIAQRCDLHIARSRPLLPDYEIPSGFDDEAAYLRHLSFQGLAGRYEEVTPEISSRATYELDVIISMGFTGYFLIVWDFVRHAREQGIPVGPGRGSGAGSIVAYALGITDIDPLKYGLLFERFLNPDRVSMPDFDIDFCFERRGEVIDYVTGKYGTDRVGQIITFGTLKAKAVLRDVARVLDLSYSEADHIAKLVPVDPKMTLEKALAEVAELKEIRARGGVYTELIDTALKLEGLSRHASTHAAGIVIGKEELTRYVPLYRDPKTGAVTTQFTMDQLEDCGLIKMDFLGLKTLTLVQNTQDLIRETDPNFDIERVSERDPKTFAMLGEGKSICVFQFESEGMQQVLKRARPNRIEDLIALNALYRPGPMQNIDQFVDSKHGRMSISYPHPSLKHVLEETYGVIVYQEQVMEIVRIVGGFSLGQADILRRAMGKKKPKEMARMKVDYLAGARAKGIDAQTAESIFTLLQPFADYGFNKSHAAAYSVLAYKTAYLKANYPAHFMAANLTNEMQSTDKFAEYLAECRLMGITVLPPSVNRSGAKFSVDRGSIVFGLLGIKNVGSSAVDEIIREREAGGAYPSFADMLARVDLRAVNRKVLETLIQAGVFDEFDTNRRRLFETLPRLLDIAHAKAESRKTGQVSLFADCEDEEFAPIAVDDGIEDWSPRLRLGYERELLGSYFTGHPLDEKRSVWAAATTLDLSRVEQAAGGREYSVVGLVAARRTTTSRSGDPLTFATVEDYQGTLELMVAGPEHEELARLLVPGEVVGVVGSLSDRGGRIRLKVREVKEPEAMDRRDRGRVHLRLAATEFTERELLALRGHLYENAGRCPLYIHVGVNGSESVIRAGDQLAVSSRPEAVDRMRAHPLVKEIWLEEP